MTERFAVLSMDIEEWYHLDYLDAAHCDRSVSVLDGLDRYRDILARHNILSSFFVLGEQVRRIAPVLAELRSAGHDIGSHGFDHRRPLSFDADEFAQEIAACKKELEDVLGTEVLGYRAPCFSLDRERLDLVQKAGFKYDSSRILFGEHPLYGELNLDGYEKLSSEIFRIGEFFEFQVSTQPVAGKQIPVSGGGYLRIFPWMVMSRLLDAYLATHDLYVLYIHPFELSDHPAPPLPANTSLASRYRFSIGRAGVTAKLEKLIGLLKERGYRFVTFAALREQLISAAT